MGQGVVFAVPKPFVMGALLETVRAAARSGMASSAAPPYSGVTARAANDEVDIDRAAER